MFILALVGTGAAVVTGIIAVGWLIDSGMDANPELKGRIGRFLRRSVAKEPEAWFQSANETALQAFDKLYGGNSTFLELAVRVGLVVSPVALVILRSVLAASGAAKADTTDLLLLALLLAFVYAAIGSAIIIRGAFSLVVSAVVVVVFGYIGVVTLDIISGGTFGIIVAIIVAVMGGLISFGFGLVIFSGIGVAIGGIGEAIGGCIGSIVGIVIGVVVGVVLFGVIPDFISVIIGFVLPGVIPDAIRAGIFGVIFGVIGVFLFGAIFLLVGGGGWRIPFHPLKTLGWSVVFVFIVGLIQQDAGREFVNAIFADPKVLTFVAFNVFADWVSLWETRWVLERGATASLRALSGLVTFDLVASASIYLILPTVLYPEIREYVDAVQFRGDRPWLGILFWTTFSTSILFYLFVAAALLARPLAAVLGLFGWISRPFDLEAHPARCLGVAMALVATTGFLAGGFVQAV